jgi:hypothetical protein
VARNLQQRICITVDKEQLVRNTGDAISALGVLGTIVKLLPAVAALASLVWTVMRIVEMLTGKAFHLTAIGKFLWRKK